MDQLAAGELALGRLDRAVQLPTLADSDDTLERDPAFLAGELVDDVDDADRVNSDGLLLRQQSLGFDFAHDVGDRGDVGARRLDNGRVPSFSKSRRRGAISLRRSSTILCAQARDQASQRPVPRSRPSRVRPRRSSSPPPSIPMTTASHRAFNSASDVICAGDAAQKSAPTQLSDWSARPISMFRCWEAQRRSSSSPFSFAAR